jgi:hypothetical protein
MEISHEIMAIFDDVHTCKIEAIATYCFFVIEHVKFNKNSKE